MQLSPDFSEFIGCCVAREVRFLIVGGYALAAHGHPRSGRLQDLADAEALENGDVGSAG